MKTIHSFIMAEEGLTTVEYAIAGGLVGAAVIVVFTDLGTAVTTTIQTIVDTLTPTA